MKENSITTLCTAKESFSLRYAFVGRFYYYYYYSAMRRTAVAMKEKWWKAASVATECISTRAGPRIRYGYDDDCHEYCVESLPRCDKAQGDFLKGKPHGKGVIYRDGDRYNGEVANGKPHGRGTLFYRNGNQYEGEFRVRLALRRKSADEVFSRRFLTMVHRMASRTAAGSSNTPVAPGMRAST